MENSSDGFQTYGKFKSEKSPFCPSHITRSESRHPPRALTLLDTHKTAFSIEHDGIYLKLIQKQWG